MVLANRNWFRKLIKENNCKLTVFWTSLVLDIYRPQTLSLRRLCFHRCLSVQSLSSGVSDQGVSVQKVSVQGASVQGGSLSMVGGLCPGGSLSRGISVQGGLCQGYVRAVCILLECILVPIKFWTRVFILHILIFTENQKYV